MSDRINYKKLTSRPDIEHRLFVSQAIENVINEVSAKIADPELRAMFAQDLPNTLDTTTYFLERNGHPDTYVATGDIPAMWLRDSAAQEGVYLRFANREDKLQKMLAGVVFRQTECVLIDPYANAYRHPHMKRPPRSFMWGFGNGWHKGVWERKYELDSLAGFLRFSNSYYKATGDIEPFNDSWVQAVSTVMDVIRIEQEEIAQDTEGNMYRALRPNGKPMPKFSNNGEGPANKKVGLSRNLYRPSDDEAMYPYLIPANAMAVVALRALPNILENISEPGIAAESLRLADEIDAGIQSHGIVDDSEQGKLFAYEVDGFGNYILMDDPNVPSLLSLPYLGYCSLDDPVYQNTRRFILSDAHEYFLRGKYEGQSSPHVKPETNFWPIATIMRAMTSDDDAEIISCLKALKETHAGTRFMHESINVNNPRRYSRPWFGWANSLFGEMILHLEKTRPWILEQKI